MKKIAPYTNSISDPNPKKAVRNPGIAAATMTTMKIIQKAISMCMIGAFFNEGLLFQFHLE